MGTERAITRWYALRQLIQHEIASQQARLEQLRPERRNTTEYAEIEHTIAHAQARLLDLGPCPKSLMG